MSTTSLPLPPPTADQGLAAWVRRRLFGSWLDSAITLAFGLLLLWAVFGLTEWAFFDAVWSVADADRCKQATGACWAVIDARFRLILFGLYPFDEQWRSTMACLAIVVTIVLSCLPICWHMWRLTLIWLLGFGAFVALMYGGILGLKTITTEQWGGLSLTVFIFAAVALVGMPLAVGLALARRSKLPVISAIAGFLIDITRSLPLLTILFAAAVIIPFAVPDWAQGDKLLRVILAFALFFACYQAEILRAGIQAIAEGQEEAATALGLRYWPRIGLIVLPQAFRHALPATINQFVITFKETSLVTIIGFFDLMASGNAAFGTGQWSNMYIEVYVFVAAIYFVFVFGLSRYGAYLERRMRVGHD